MEATYILNPLDSNNISWEKGLKEFYVPNFKKIIEYIDKKYKNNPKKYKHIVEAEVSGRTCGPPGRKVSVIKPDPKHSMLEIATDKPYREKKIRPKDSSTDILYSQSLNMPSLYSNDLLVYSKSLRNIQKGAIKDLNEFYHKEKLWKKKKIFNSFVPYPYAMSNRLKNANIILGNMKILKKKIILKLSFYIYI